MSWGDALCAVYDKIQQLKDTIVTPLMHSRRDAQIEVTLNIDGSFVRAIQVDDESKSTIFPVTEKSSGGRTSGSAPHAFAEEIQYLVGNACGYTIVLPKKRDESEDKYADRQKKFFEQLGKKFNDYITQLKCWFDSDYSHWAVESLYHYISQGTLVEDLVKSKILVANDDKNIVGKLSGTDISRCFVRFRILNNHGWEERTWLDVTLHEKYFQYVVSNYGTVCSLCYATGEQTYCIEKHPSVDGTYKLFSTQKDSGFKFIGRFLDAEQAVSIGYIFSGKLHNALKWLIERQAVRIGDSYVIIWDSELDNLPNVCDATDDFIEDFVFDCDDLPVSFMNYKNAIVKSIFGNKKISNLSQKVMILILEPSNPNGRIAITLYNELLKSEFYDNLVRWHSDTSWFYFSKDKGVYFNSISLSRLAEYLCGEEGREERSTTANNRKRDTIVRLLPCVVNGRRFPSDVLKKLVNRTTRRSSYQYTWNYLLSMTCGLIRKSKIEKGEKCDMALDRDCTNRSYLFGRLLAVAEVAEKSTYYENEKRETNAERYFEKFSNSPSTTWSLIAKRLLPYFSRMNKGTKRYYQTVIDEIMNKFEYDDFSKNSKLDPDYLLGYSCQRKDLYTKRSKNIEEEST